MNTFMKPLPFEEPHRLVGILGTHAAHGAQVNVTIHDFEAYREQQQVFEGLASYNVVSVNIGGRGGRRTLRSCPGDGQRIRDPARAPGLGAHLPARR